MVVFSERDKKEETTRWIQRKKEETMIFSLIFATEKLISLYKPVLKRDTFNLFAHYFPLLLLLLLIIVI